MTAYAQCLRRVLAGAAIVLACLPAPVLAADARERLQQFFTEIKTLRADFVQTVRGGAMHAHQDSRGSLAIQRPNRFRWDYRQPFEQQIVADGQQLWIYDPELEQVIVRPLDAALGSTPAVLLSGGGSLDERFVLEDVADTAEGLAWLRLRPRASDTGFEEILLGFDAQNLRIMELRDSFDQHTRINFVKLERNPRLDARLFVFTPPPGVDVVGEGVEVFPRP